MARPAVRIATGLVAGALALSACGSSSGPTSGRNDSSVAPARELTNAISALDGGNALTVSIGLGASTADILRLGTDKSGNNGPTPAQAKALAEDRIVFEDFAPPGKTLAEASASGGNGAFAMRLQSPSATYASFLVVNKSLYAQINLKYFFDLGGAPNQYRALLRRSASLPPFAKAAVEGKWVSLPAATVKSLQGFLKGATGGSAPSPSASQIHAITHAAISTLLGDLNVTRTGTGTTDHLTLTANLRNVLHDEYTAVFPRLSALSGSITAIPHPAFNKVPNVNVTVLADVTGGALSMLTLNTGQFAKSIPFSLPVTATFSRSGAPITAPAGATPLDLSQLFQLGGSSGLFNSSGA